MRLSTSMLSTFSVSLSDIEILISKVYELIIGRALSLPCSVISSPHLYLPRCQVVPSDLFPVSLCSCWIFSYLQLPFFLLVDFFCEVILLLLLCLPKYVSFSNFFPSFCLAFPRRCLPSPPPRPGTFGDHGGHDAFDVSLVFLVINVQAHASQAQKDIT